MHTKRIYTIGYQRYTPEELMAALEARGVKRLLDVRTSPWSRKPGFHKRDLEHRFGPFYEWRGDMLGGKGDGITDETLEWLCRQEGPLALLCMEDDPCGCHRFWLIGRMLLGRGFEAYHIHGAHEFTTTQLLGRCGDVPPWERQQRLDL